MHSNWESISSKWKNYFLSSLDITKNLSKDKETQVGAIIIDCEKKVIVSSGYNGLPRGVKDLENRLTRPDKYMYTIHAEVNSIITALKLGRDIDGMTLISSLAPCCNCTAMICNSGIREIVCPDFDMNHVSCGIGYTASINMLQESGIKINRINLEI